MCLFWEGNVRKNLQLPLHVWKTECSEKTQSSALARLQGIAVPNYSTMCQMCNSQLIYMVIMNFHNSCCLTESKGYSYSVCSIMAAGMRLLRSIGRKM
jgi:Na+-translocating ferredoxin:NAD+ oxidoreductase RnfA subunit